MSKNKIDKKNQKKIAKKRIEKLFLQAEVNVQKKRFDLADRYVHIARKIQMRYQIRMPKKFKRKFCKHCYSYLVPNVNSRVRINRGKIIVYCKNCNRYMRFLIK